MIVILKPGQKLAQEDFEKARQDYETYIKITIDIERKVVALGGEYHSDAEKLLLENGSKQDDIWGGGFDLDDKKFVVNAIINLRSGRNDSADILDPKIRERFLVLAKEVLKDYVQ
ncbi:MAG: DUF5674 family protein [Candidatus Microgenomates bacterium]|jgi:hypothetical protein